MIHFIVIFIQNHTRININVYIYSINKTLMKINRNLNITLIWLISILPFQMHIFVLDNCYRYIKKQNNSINLRIAAICISQTFLYKCFEDKFHIVFLYCF